MFIPTRYLEMDKSYSAENSGIETAMRDIVGDLTSQRWQVDILRGTADRQY